MPRGKARDKYPHLMTSKYKGKCETCKGVIGVGDDIYTGRYQGKSYAWHHECWSATGRDEFNKRESDDADARQRERNEARARILANTGNRDTTRYVSSEQLSADAPIDRLLRFDSFGAFLDHAENVPQTMELRNGSDMQETKWSGGAESVAHAIEMGRDGWHDVRADVDLLVDNIETNFSERFDISFVPEFDVAGAEVDIDRYLMNEPENMIEYVPAAMPRKGRVVKVLCSAAWPSVTSTDTIRKYGAAICAMVEILRKRNLSPDIWIENPHGPNGTHSVLIHVHTAADYLDVDNIMFAICHPAMQRRLMFRVQETLPTSTRKRCGFYQGYGAIMRYQCAGIVEPNVIAPNGMSSDVDRIAYDPAGWIAEAIESLGMVLEGGE